MTYRTVIFGDVNRVDIEYLKGPIEKVDPDWEFASYIEAIDFFARQNGLKKYIVVTNIYDKGGLYTPTVTKAFKKLFKKFENVFVIDNVDDSQLGKALATIMKKSHYDSADDIMERLDLGTMDAEIYMCIDTDTSI